MNGNYYYYLIELQMGFYPLAVAEIKKESPLKKY
jgi:neutral trehalase